MDLIVRRQSEQVGKKFVHSPDGNSEDGDNNKKCKEFYDCRKWEWGHLRVSSTIYGLTDFSYKL